MNEKQQRWTQNKCDRLNNYIKNKFPLSKEQWESVADYIDKIVEMSKGNSEVRSALFDTVEPYQRKAEELKAKIGVGHEEINASKSN